MTQNIGQQQNSQISPRSNTAMLLKQSVDKAQQAKMRQDKILELSIGAELAQKYYKVKKKNRECSLYGFVLGEQNYIKFKQLCRKLQQIQPGEKKGLNSKNIELDYKQRVYLFNPGTTELININQNQENKQYALPWAILQIQSSDQVVKNYDDINKERQNINGSNNSPTKQIQNLVYDEHSNNQLQIYQRLLCFYDNLLGWNITNGQITIKTVLRIDASDKQRIQTNDIWDDLQAWHLINKNQFRKIQDEKQINPQIYLNDGTEFRFCLNHFDDLQLIIKKEKIAFDNQSQYMNQNVLQGRQNPQQNIQFSSQSTMNFEKNFKCSVFIYKLYYAPLPMTEPLQQMNLYEKVKEPKKIDQNPDNMDINDPNYDHNIESLEQEIEEYFSESESDENEIVQNQDFYYIEMKGFCQDEDLLLYSKLFLQFKEKFAMAGFNFIPASLKTINQGFQ